MSYALFVALGCNQTPKSSPTDPDQASETTPVDEDSATTDGTTDGTTDTDTDTTPVDPCGACPEGTTCGTANKIPVCRDDVTGIPRFEHIFVIMMENTDNNTLMNSGNTPFLRDLAATWAFATDYHGVEHPSLPNYIELVSGSVFDNGPRSCDCDPAGGDCNLFTCNTLLHGCGCPQNQSHLGDQLDNAGVTWRAYGEDMGLACNLESNGDYAPKHIPFLYFPTLTDDGPRCADRVIEYIGNFEVDLAAGPRQFTFITPNLIHDMHDPIPAGAQNLANGDEWLSTEVPPILESTAFTDRGLLVIAWDEDESDLALSDTSDEPIPFILLSPLAKQAHVSTVHINHDSLLATFEDGLGVTRLGNAQAADPLVDFFPAE